MLVRAANHAETVVLTALLLCWEDLGEVRFPWSSRCGALVGVLGCEVEGRGLEREVEVDAEGLVWGTGVDLS